MYQQVSYPFGKSVIVTVTRDGDITTTSTDVGLNEFVANSNTNTMRFLDKAVDDDGNVIARYAVDVAKVHKVDLPESESDLRAFISDKPLEADVVIDFWHFLYSVYECIEYATMDELLYAHGWKNILPEVDTLDEFMTSNDYSSGPIYFIKFN